MKTLKKITFASCGGSDTASEKALEMTGYLQDEDFDRKKADEINRKALDFLLIC